jgi:TatA/E family protein of Tat protein translocase
MITRLITPTHLAILLAVVLLLIGPRRLPQTGRALGRSIREFTEAATGHTGPTDTLPGTGHEGGEP